MNDSLGRVVSTHPGQFSAGGVLWYVGGIMVLSGVLNMAKAELAMGAIALVIGVLLLIAPVLRWRQTLTIHENGFVWTRLTGTTTVQRGQVLGTRLHRERTRMGGLLDTIIVELGKSELSITGVAESEQARGFIAQLAVPQQTSPIAATSGGWQPPGASV